jgi:hypothetical protein
MLTVVARILTQSLIASPGTPPASSTRLLQAYPAVSRWTGHGPLSIAPSALRELDATAPGIGFERWSRQDAARALLLIGHRDQAAGDAFVADAVACFEHGDAREQESWLRAIALWPESGALLATAIDACRTNIVPVFEALACENPYPARHFPERNFNQLVLKAMFNSIAVARIVGLTSRLNPELSRMARDYAAERSAASRTVPADLHLAIHDAREPR